MSSYHTICQDLERRVRSGEWSEDDFLPSRAALATHYHVALETLQRAMRELLAKGLLVAHARRGTRVAPGVLAKAAGSRAEAVTTGTERAAVDVAVIVTAPHQQESSQLESWTPVVCRACEQEAQRLGFDLHFRFVDLARSGKEGPATIAAALATPCSARIIVDLYDKQEFRDALVAYSPSARPTVWIGGALLPFDAAQVYPDHRQAGYLAALALARAGYARIISLPVFQAEWARERARGVSDAARQLNLPLLELPSAQDTPWGAERELGRMYVHAASDQLGGPEGVRGCGIIAGNDAVGMGVLTALGELGLQPGSDAGVIGFDDYPPSRELGLSTMRPPLEEMGRSAVQLIAESLRDGNGLTKRISHRHELFRRSSIRAADAATAGGSDA